MIKFNRDGSATFTAEDGSGVVTGATGSGPTIDAAYTAFLVAHPTPVYLPPTMILAVPQADPGMTGALFIVNNTLQVSQGKGNVPVQVGATGPTGGAVVI